MKTIAARIINQLEDRSIPLKNYWFTFFFAILLRNFAEVFSREGENIFNAPPFYLLLSVLHYSLYYIFLAFLFIIIAHFGARTDINRVTCVILPSFILLLFAPIIDLMLSHGQGVPIYYIVPEANLDLVKSYFTFFGGHAGISYGMQSEILVAMFGFFCFFRVKKTSLLSSCCYTFLIYTIIFLSAISPIIVKKIMTVMGFQYQYSSMLMIAYFAILNFALMIFLFFLHNKTHFLALLKDIRCERILHYQLMMLLGVSLSLFAAPISAIDIFTITPQVTIEIILVMISLFLSCLFQIIINNTEDIEIDKISNPSRPLIRKTIDLKTYLQIGHVAFLLAIFYVALTGVKTTFLLLAFNAFYFIYSMKPLRLKRIFLISKSVIAINSLIIVMLGFIVVNKNLINFPYMLCPIFLIGYTAALSIIDLKDVEGDSAVSISTLPGLLGLKYSKLMIGFAFFLTYLSFYLLLQEPICLMPLLLGGIGQFYLINKKNFKEWQPLSLYLLSMVSVIFYLLYQAF